MDKGQGLEGLVGHRRSWRSTLRVRQSQWKRVLARWERGTTRRPAWLEGREAKEGGERDCRKRRDTRLWKGFGFHPAWEGPRGVVGGQQRGARTGLLWQRQAAAVTLARVATGGVENGGNSGWLAWPAARTDSWEVGDREVCEETLAWNPLWLYFGPLVSRAPPSHGAGCLHRVCCSAVQASSCPGKLRFLCFPWLVPGSLSAQPETNPCFHCQTKAFAGWACPSSRINGQVEISWIVLAFPLSSGSLQRAKSRIKVWVSHRHEVFCAFHCQRLAAPTRLSCYNGPTC